MITKIGAENVSEKSAIATWVYSILGTIVSATFLDYLYFRFKLSDKLADKYVRRDEFIRLVDKNDEAHDKILGKLDDIKDTLSQKEDRGRVPGPVPSSGPGTPHV